MTPPQEAEVILIRDNGITPQLVVKTCGVEQVWNLRPGQLKSMQRVMVEWLLKTLNGSIISQSSVGPNGRPSDGELKSYRTITVNSRASENGQVAARR